MPEKRIVYVLQSESNPKRFYTGLTSDLARRLTSHNAGLSKHTSTGCPWRVVTQVIFSNEAAAEAFETYLKSGSGRAFAQQHFRQGDERCDAGKTGALRQLRQSRPPS